MSAASPSQNARKNRAPGRKILHGSTATRTQAKPGLERATLRGDEDLDSRLAVRSINVGGCCPISANLSRITSEWPTIHELAEFADKGAFLGIGRIESLCLKRGNHFLENTLSKAFIKRSVTLQPSEEQGTSKHIDQQFWIGRRLQFS